jgi:hypothetical protein
MGAWRDYLGARASDYGRSNYASGGREGGESRDRTPNDLFRRYGQTILHKYVLLDK